MYKDNKNNKAQKLKKEVDQQELGAIVADETKEADKAGEKVIRNKRVAWIVIVFTVVVIFLLLSFVVIPWANSPNYDTDNPIVRIKLDNGMDIDVEVFAKQSPIASSVFLYLVAQNYFNDTVIVDYVNGYVKWGGYTDYVTHRSKDKSYTDNIANKHIKSIKDKYNNIFEPQIDNPFGFSARRDSVDTALNAKSQEQYYLSALTDTVTEYQIAGLDREQNIIKPRTGQVRTLNAQAFGQVLGDKSKSNMDKLAKLKDSPITNEERNGINKAKYGNSFLPSTTNIKIKSIKAYNLKNENSKYGSTHYWWEFNRPQDKYNIYDEIFLDPTKWLTGTPNQNSPYTGWSKGALS